MSVCMYTIEKAMVPVKKSDIVKGDFSRALPQKQFFSAYKDFSHIYF